MTIQHKSLKDELLYLIGRSTAPMSSADLYEKCELADEVTKVAKAVANLQSDGKIVRVEGDGRARYKLATGVAAPAPAGKAGRSMAVQKDDAAHSRPPGLDIPQLGDHPADAEIAKGLDLVNAQLFAERLADDPEVSGDLYARAKNSEQVAQQLSDERLADAIIARLKRQLAPTLCELEAAAGMDRMNVHIHIEQVDVHLGGL